jgi:hypothetical protein
MESWPPPPARGSAPPPPPSGIRAIAPSVHELLDDDILEEEVVVAPPAKRDPIATLLEDIGDLELFGSAWQAAGICAAALVKALGAEAVLVHAVDAQAAELRIIGVHGAKTRNLLGECATVEDDFVGSTVASNGRPMTMRFDGELPRVAPPRLGLVEAKRSLVAVPVMASSGCVAVIEVVDADESLASKVAVACGHVAERMLKLFAARAA